MAYTAQRQKRTDVYQKVSELIINRLEEGDIPWMRSWNGYGPARNALTQKPYRGINAFLLNEVFRDRRPFYLTFKQVKQNGGIVKKGSKSLPIIFWSFTYQMKGSGLRLSEQVAHQLGPDKYTKQGFIRYYNVFSIDQVDGLELEIPEPERRPLAEQIDSCEAIIDNYEDRPSINHGGDRAFYSVHTDQVNVPDAQMFHSNEEYYATVFHELVHSTGAEKRLKREGITSTSSTKGSERYGFEELVAELGAAFLCTEAGISSEKLLTDSAAYIQGWMKALKGDPQLVIKAAAKAQKAADHMLQSELVTA